MILIVELGFGFVSAFATSWFILFVVLAAVSLGLAWARTFEAEEIGPRFREKVKKFGVCILGDLLLLVGLAVFWRFSARWSTALFAVV